MINVRRAPWLDGGWRVAVTTLPAPAASTGASQRKGVAVAVIDAEFADFVRANERALLRLGWLLMADRHAAEDLVQTALEKTLPKWASIRQDDPMAYVHRVMLNTRTSWWRRHRGRESLTSDVTDRGTDDATEAFAERDRLTIALRSLTAGQRKVVVLAALRGHVRDPGRRTARMFDRHREEPKRPRTRATAARPCRTGVRHTNGSRDGDGGRMNEDHDPLIADALRRLAGAAPQPRADRLQAVVAGVHRRRQVRMTTSALTAAAFVVAAAVGVHVWTHDGFGFDHRTQPDRARCQCEPGRRCK